MADARRVISHFQSRSGKTTMRTSALVCLGVGSIVAFLGVAAAATGSGSGAWALGAAGLTLLAAVVVVGAMLRRLGTRSAIVLVLPVFVGYNALSAALAGTESARAQVALVAAGAIGFVAGYLVTMPKPAGVPPEVSSGPLRIRKRLLLWFLIVGLCLSAYSFMSSGIPVLSPRVAEARLAAFASGVVGTLITTTLTVSTVLGIAGAISEPRPRIKAGYAAVAVAALLVLYGFGNRGLLFVPLITAAVYALLQKPQRLPWVIAGGVMLLIGVSYLGLVRDLQAFGMAHVESLLRAGTPQGLLLLGPVLTYFRGTSVALDYILATFPAQVPHPGGATFFSALLSPLPGEQATPGQFLKMTLGLDFVGGGLATGAIGGLVMDFGVLGVPVGLGVLGALARVAENWSWKGPRSLMVYSYLIGHLWFMNYSHPLAFFSVLTIPLGIYLCQRPDSDRHGKPGAIVSKIPDSSISAGSGPCR